MVVHEHADTAIETWRELKPVRAVVAALKAERDAAAKVVDASKLSYPALHVTQRPGEEARLVTDAPYDDAADMIAALLSHEDEMEAARLAESESMKAEKTQPPPALKSTSDRSALWRRCKQLLNFFLNGLVLVTTFNDVRELQDTNLREK